MEAHEFAECRAAASFNQIYPIKEYPGQQDEGATVQLVVVSPGYVMAFDVNCEMVTSLSCGE